MTHARLLPLPLLAFTACATPVSPPLSPSNARSEPGPHTTCSAPATCAGRLTLPGTTFTLPYLSSAPLEIADPRVTRLVVFVEGFHRDAEGAQRTMVSAATKAGALGDTIVATPEFQALTSRSGARCKGHADTPAPTDLVWGCDTWSDGLPAENAPTVSSFGALDALIRAALAANPTMTHVVVAGFSAGGQFVQRYVAANQVDGRVAASTRYVVGSPSSYMYLDARRPVNASTCTPAGCPDGFAPYAAADACPRYDAWKYGLGRLAGGAADFTASDLAHRYVSRPVTYLLGTEDQGDTRAAHFADLDVSCAAEAQGPYRYPRGLAFYFYARGVLGARGSRLVTVPGCAHSPGCVFESQAGVEAVFGADPVGAARTEK